MAGTKEKTIREKLATLAAARGLDVCGGQIRRSSSRFCLGVEHGDYNGTELFGVGTDRFIWLAYKPNDLGKVRIFSANFPDDGTVTFELGKVPAPGSPTVAHSWARFPFGVDHVLHRAGMKLHRGYDGVIYGNIPGGGMSRSASLSLNLILTILEVNKLTLPEEFQIIDLAQAVENDYIGSPCGQLDQIMIYFARDGMGTHYDPQSKTISYLPLGSGSTDFRIVSLDTGTVRPGLEKSTYKIRRAECEELVALAKEDGFPINCLADIKEPELFAEVSDRFAAKRPELWARMAYIYGAQRRFSRMLEAWRRGDIETVGRIFREDGIGLRDQYQISGPELETMCDIARTIPGVLGERMLGGGDKGAAGALVRSESVADLRSAIGCAYPRSHPDFADKYAIHDCRVVGGIEVLPGL